MFRARGTATDVSTRESVRRFFGFTLVLFLYVSQTCSVLAGSSSNNADADAKGSLEVQGQVFRGPIATPDVVSIRATEAPLTDRGRYTKQGLTFACSGMECAASLYLPKAPLSAPASSGRSSKAPVVVMAHGLGGIRTWLDKFATAFAAEGFAVFAFDYRYWGSSDGQPRQWISVAKQHEDWFAAITHVQTHLRNKVDTSRLSLWGTSFAGGHVIYVASKLPGIKAIVSNVPHLDGFKASQANAAMRGPRGNAVVAMAALADLAADAKRGPPVYIPLAGRIGSSALMQLTDHDMAHYSLTHAATETLWRNLTRARFATEQSLQRYSPISVIHQVHSPLLIIAATRDTLCPYSAAVAAAAKAPNATLVTFDVGHFDPYSNPTFEAGLAKQIKFLKTYGV